MDTSFPAGDDVQSTSDGGWASGRWKLALGVGAVVLAAGVFVGCRPSVPPAAPDHPLPECSAPNCERSSSAHDVPAETLFAATRRALDRLGPTTHRRAPDSLRASAVYQVGGIFKDDVTVVVTPNNGESTLHVRSKSRKGYYDFEVNRRRVHNLLEAVSQELSQSRPTSR